MLPKRLSRLPMCQPMEARLTHPQLPIQLVSFFSFLFSGFSWLTFVVFKKREMGLGFGVVLWGYFVFFAFFLFGFPLFSLVFSFFSLPFPCSVFCWKSNVIRPCD